MSAIPLVYVKKGKEVQFYNKRWVPTPSEESKINTRLKDTTDDIYIIDIDGYKKNHANLNFYRNISKKISLWVDAAPRFPEDVMDLFVSGVNKITLMWKIVKDKDLMEIREMCTGEIYLFDDNRIEETLKKARKLGFNGIVTKQKKTRWQHTDTSIWIINQGVNGEEELQKVNP